MACLICNNINTSKDKCVEEALDILKLHYIFLKNAINEKDHQIDILKKKCESLTISYKHEDPPGSTTHSKKRKYNISQSKQKISADVSHGEKSFCDEGNQTSELNLALNSEQLFVDLLSPTKIKSRGSQNTLNSSFLFKSPLKNNSSLILVPNETKVVVEQTFMEKTEGKKKSFLSRNRNTKSTCKQKQTRLQLVHLPKSSSFTDVVAGNSENMLNEADISSGPSQQISYVLEHENSQLNNIELQEKNKNVEGKENMDSFSIAFISPKKQDIVFLDDTGSSSPNESIDLVQDLMKCGSIESFTHLKRIEGRRYIKILPNNCPINVKQEKLMSDFPSIEIQKFDHSHIKVRKNQSKMSNLKYIDKVTLERDRENQNIKKEKITPDSLPPFYELEEDSNKKLCKNVDELENKKTNEIKWPNEQCLDCQKYTKLNRGRLSEKQIKEHLRKCKCKQEENVIDNLTPDNFWNPLLHSFAENDRRNEVLIDSRFLKKNITEK